MELLSKFDSDVKHLISGSSCPCGWCESDGGLNVYCCPCSGGRNAVRNDKYSEARGRRKECRRRGLSGKEFRDCVRGLRSSDKSLTRAERKELARKRKDAWRSYKQGTGLGDGMDDGSMGDDGMGDGSMDDGSMGDGRGKGRGEVKGNGGENYRNDAGDNGDDSGNGLNGKTKKILIASSVVVGVGIISFIVYKLIKK